MIAAGVMGVEKRGLVFRGRLLETKRGVSDGYVMGWELFALFHGMLG